MCIFLLNPIWKFYFFLFFPWCVILLFNITKNKREREGVVVPTSFVIVRYFVVHIFGAQPASGFGIVHELRLHHRHHGAVVLVVLPPLLLLVKNSPSSPPPPLYLAITTTSLPPQSSLLEFGGKRRLLPAAEL